MHLHAAAGMVLHNSSNFHTSSLLSIANQMACTGSLHPDTQSIPGTV